MASLQLWMSPSAARFAKTRLGAQDMALGMHARRFSRMMAELADCGPRAWELKAMQQALLAGTVELRAYSRELLDRMGVGRSLASPPQKGGDRG